MNIENHQASIDLLTGPDDIIDTDKDRTAAKKDNVQNEIEGAEPSEDETEVNPEDAKITRSE